MAGRQPSGSRNQRRDESPPLGDTAPPSVRRLHLVGADTYRDWEAIYRDNVERVYRLMFVKVGNRPDAEDLTTEVFLTALGPLRVSASVGEVRAYLLATARTVLAAHWRRTLGRQITTLDDDRIEDVPTEAPSNEVATGRAQRILAALPERYPSDPRTAVPAGVLDQGGGRRDGCQRRQRQGAAVPGATPGGGRG